MMIDEVKRIREFYIKNMDTARNNIIFQVEISSRDIHGGLNFEEEFERYCIDETGWFCDCVIEETIQPEYGQTITRLRHISKHYLSDNEFLDVLNKNPSAAQLLDDFLIHIRYRQS